MNRKSWEYANEKFNKIKGDFEEEIKSGGKILPPEVIQELDPLKNEELVHLMCNDGREAAYIASNFESQVWGVDFSSHAIRFAKQINTNLGLNNKFIESDVFEWLNTTDKDFDKALTTLGSIRWIYNESEYFRSVYNRLRDGGTLLIWDFHPLIKCIDGDMNVVHDYPIETFSFVREEGVHDYISDEDSYSLVSRDDDTEYSTYNNENEVYFTHHSISDLITSAIENDFKLSAFQEYGFIWEEKYLPWLVEVSPRRFETPDQMSQIPLSFIIKLEKSE